VHSWCPPF